MSERSTKPLSGAMSQAMQMMDHARKQGHDPHGVAANTLDRPRLVDFQVWMDWRTAEALERRGLVRIVDGTDVYLEASGG